MIIRISFFIGLAALISAVLIGSFFLLRIATRGPSIPLYPAPETTRIIGPVRADGQLDYARAVNEHFSFGVTSQNNALAGIAGLVEIADCPDDIKVRFYAMLGVDVPSADSKVFKDPIEWLEDGGFKLTADEKLRFEWGYQKSYTETWESDDQPLLAQWLNEMKPILDDAVRASNRNRYYHPILSWGNKPPVIVASALPFILSTRNIGRALCSRAHLRAAQGDFAGWLEDVVAIKQLANHTATGHSLTQKIVGVALHSMADDAIVGGVKHRQFDSNELTHAKTVISAIEMVGGYRECIQHGETLMALEVVQCIANGDYEALEISPEKAEFERGIDWNLVASDVDNFFQSLLPLIESPRTTTYWMQLEEFEDGVENLLSETNMTWDYYLGDYASRSRCVANITIGKLFPAIKGVLEAQASHETRHVMNSLTIDLERYRLANGRYPLALSDLVPKFRQSLENDLVTGAPFIYSADDVGYQLYSVGTNEVDDDGKASLDLRDEFNDIKPFDQFVAERTALE